MNLFIAGCEQHYNRIYSLLANNGPMLFSYYHLSAKNGHKMDQKFVDHYNKLKNSNALFICDSGLFTMMFGAGKHEVRTMSDLIEYTHKYLDNMNGIGYQDYTVEMDVHKLLGVKKLQEFRKIFVAKRDIEKVIFVWHIELGIDGWKQMCKDYPYVALSIPELRIVMKPNYIKKFMQKMIKTALDINPDIKIHLLGCTSYDLLEQVGYYSADSTSWQSALRYGEFKVPHTKDMISHAKLQELANEKIDKIDENTKILREKYGIINNSQNENRDTMSILSIAFFRHMAEAVNRDYFNRDYPVFDKDIKLIIER